MKMRTALTIALMLGASACASVNGTSQSVFTRALFNETTVGGAGYPVVISGAENVGLTPVTISQNMRFPARFGAHSSFRAAAPDEAFVNHAQLAIGAAGESTLTFLHGDRRTGVGTFTLPPQAYGDPRALGSTTATLIGSMLEDSRQRTRSDPWDF